MEGVLNLNKTIITVGSITYAIKCRKLLFKNGIRSKLVKLDSSDIENGCTNGIEITEKDFLTVASILRSNGINYKIHK